VATAAANVRSMRTTKSELSSAGFVILGGMSCGANVITVLVALWRVDSVKANALAIDFQRISVGNEGLPDY